MIAQRMGKRNILVVDDDDSVSQTLTLLLQSDGHSVDAVASGAEALALFEPDKFDVVFTDFFMPGMSGEKLAAEIKARAPGQPVVLLTGYPEKFRASGGRLLDIDLMLGKPFEIETLRETITRFGPAQPAG